MTARSDALSPHHRTVAGVVEIDVDTCSLTYGTAPCTAAGAVGSECYNTFATCQDRANYARATRTIKFCTRGGVPAGETIRAYVKDIDTLPAAIDPGQGLAKRGEATITAIDEPAPDHLDDPYHATRARVAGGTWWLRFLARNPNYSGREVRIKRGPVTSPFDWNTFQAETYILSRITRAESGTVTIKCRDKTDLLLSAKYPAPSSGKLAADLPAYSLITSCRVAAGANEVRFAESADALDGSYVGQEVHLVTGEGAGQRRIIASYVGATRTATLTADWATVPTANTTAEVSPLQMMIDDASGYASSGYVAIGDEVMRYTGKSGNVLSWPDGTYRKQFGTDRLDHSEGDKVQQCAIFSSAAPYDVLVEILTAGGITEIDTAIETELDTWATGAEINACIAEPEACADLIRELCADLNLELWWDAVAGEVKGVCNAPVQDWGVTTLDADSLILESTRLQQHDDKRITRAATDYAIRSATGDRDAPGSYLRGVLVIDAEAESANGYGDIRPDVARSRLMTEANETHVTGVAWARLFRARNSPITAIFDTDLRADLQVGQLIKIESRNGVGFDGYSTERLFRITSVDTLLDRLKIEARSAVFGLSFDAKRFFFIAPDGTPDYDAASAEEHAKYGFITNDDGLMNDGSDGYYITI